MSDSEEEDAGGFGDDFGGADEDDSEDESGFGGGFGEDEDDEDDEDAGGFGDDFGGADEEDEEEDGGDAAPAAAAPIAPGAWAAFAKANLNEGCSDAYQHPGLGEIWDKPISQIVGPLDQVAAPPLFKILLRFMGDLEATGPDKIGAMESVSKLTTSCMKSDILCKEIYMQICKQLHKNTSKISHARGFILLNMFLGCVPPPPEMISAVVDIIEQGPVSYRKYSQAKLQHGNARPPRKSPPLRVELNAVKAKSPITLPITIPGGKVVMLEVEPLVTGAELVKIAAVKIALKSADGWGIRIIAPKPETANTSCGIGGVDHYVLDVISLFESQYGAGNWKFEFVKESFGEWHTDVSEDSYALDLVAKQMFEGIRDGKYAVKHEGGIGAAVTTEDYVELASYRYYMEHGDELLSLDELQEYLPTLLPKKLVILSGKGAKKIKHASTAKKAETWAELVEKCHAKLECVKKSIPVDVVQMQLIDKVKALWPHFFSSFFDLKQTGGPDVKGKKGLFVAINETGIFFGQAGTSEITKSLPYEEIDKFSTNRQGQFGVLTAIIEGYRSTANQFMFDVLNSGDTTAMIKLATRHKSSASN